MTTIQTYVDSISANVTDAVNAIENAKQRALASVVQSEITGESLKLIPALVKHSEAIKNKKLFVKRKLLTISNLASPSHL